MDCAQMLLELGFVAQTREQGDFNHAIAVAPE